MSPKDGKEAGDVPVTTSASPNPMLAVATPSIPRRISPPNVIYFLDNTQDARSRRSDIQRHTAYHAAAQRREARLQSSREIAPRNLEWHRRALAPPRHDDLPPEIKITSTVSEMTDSFSPSHQGPGMEQSSAGRSDAPSSQQSSDNPPAAGVEHQSPRQVSTPILEHIGADEACNYFLQAFQHHLQAQLLPTQDPGHWQERESSHDQLSRGLAILRQRLDDAQDSCSDRTIQGVLILFVYASKFQSPQEAASHKEALEQMIRLRGGLASFGESTVLREQLERFYSGEVEHILNIPRGLNPV